MMNQNKYYKYQFMSTTWEIRFLPFIRPVRCIFLHLTFSLHCLFYFLLSTVYSNRPPITFWLTTHHLRISDLQHCLAMTSYNCWIQTGARADTKFKLFIFQCAPAPSFNGQSNVHQCIHAYFLCQNSCACPAITQMNVDYINNPKVLYSKFFYSSLRHRPKLNTEKKTEC